MLSYTASKIRLCVRNHHPLTTWVRLPTTVICLTLCFVHTLRDWAVQTLVNLIVLCESVCWLWIAKIRSNKENKVHIQSKDTVGQEVICFPNPASALQAHHPECRNVEFWISILCMCFSVIIMYIKWLKPTYHLLSALSVGWKREEDKKKKYVSLWIEKIKQTLKSHEWDIQILITLTWEPFGAFCHWALTSEITLLPALIKK